MTPLLAQTIVSAVLDAAAYAHVASTWFMVGLIWFVQLVHYPMMARADRAAFDDFEREHQRRTTWIVAPVMLVEAVTCFAMLPPFVGGYMSPQGLLGTAAAALLIGVWVSTAALQVPDHRRLEQGFDAAVHARLVRLNWLRTAAWSLRGMGVAVVLPFAA